jgi:hypothetical protein
LDSVDAGSSFLAFPKDFKVVHQAESVGRAPAVGF